MSMTFRVALVAIALSIAGVAHAQKPVTKTNTVKAKMTIQAIDSTRREVTLKSEDGSEDTFIVSPEITRFNELKVGDRINMSYTESVVVMMHKPDAPAPKDNAAISVSQGKMPGATMAQQQSMTVTVKAIDTKLPSITVQTPDGRIVTRKVEERKNLDGIKVGDKLDITYTESVMLSAERAK